MKLYLIQQDTNLGYDTYDSAVVIATSEEEAKTIHPGGCRWEEVGQGQWSWTSDWGLMDWTVPENVTVTCIGAATQGQVGDVVCASFNAG